MVQSLLDCNQPGSVFRFAGSLAHLLGGFGVTMAANVPRNDALAALDPDSMSAVAAWTPYLSGWTSWNHDMEASGAQ